MRAAAGILAQATFRPWTSSVKPPRRWRVVVAGDQPTLRQGSQLTRAGDRCLRRPRRSGSTPLAARGPHKPAGPVAARSPRCGSGPNTSGRTGGARLQTLHIPNWCGCTTEYLPVPDGPGWWQLVPIWDPNRRLTHCGGTSPQSLADEVVAIQRLREPPRPVTLAKGQQTLYEVTLSAVPSRAWRAAFLRPPPALTRRGSRQSSAGWGSTARITFRTTPRAAPPMAPPDRPLDRLRQLGGGGVVRVGHHAGLAAHLRPDSQPPNGPDFGGQVQPAVSFRLTGSGWCRLARAPEPLPA